MVIILLLILIPLLGRKIYLEVDNIFYENKIERMMGNNELTVQIESSIEHKTLKMDDYEIYYFVSGKENNDLIVFYILHFLTIEHLTSK